MQLGPHSPGGRSSVHCQPLTANQSGAPAERCGEAEGTLDAPEGEHLALGI